MEVMGKVMRRISHWWRYIKLRYYWRAFWMRLHWKKLYWDGRLRWCDARTWPWLRLHNQYPGPSMSKDEYDHWFG